MMIKILRGVKPGETVWIVTGTHAALRSAMTRLRGEVAISDWECSVEPGRAIMKIGGRIVHFHALNTDDWERESLHFAGCVGYLIADDSLGTLKREALDMISSLRKLPIL
jgi:hypothetical protein